jgi:hypothetical protein
LAGTLVSSRARKAMAAEPRFYGGEVPLEAIKSLVAGMGLAWDDITFIAIDPRWVTVERLKRNADGEVYVEDKAVAVDTFIYSVEP